MKTIRTASVDDIEQLSALLGSAHLPLEGVRDHIDSFLVAEEDRAIVGGIGLEMYGTTALLRSAIVREDLRNSGLGTMLYDRLVLDARARHVRRLILLTTTAEKYFERKGFRRIDRESVSGPVRDSAEFVSACPASAVCMALDLE